MRDRGVSILLAQVSSCSPTAMRAVTLPISGTQASLAQRASIPSPRIRSGRAFDNFRILAEMAAAFGMETTVELIPGLLVGDLPTALAAIHHVGRRDFRLLIDTMHLVGAGVGAADIAVLQPDLFGYIEIAMRRWCPGMLTTSRK